MNAEDYKGKYSNAIKRLINNNELNNLNIKQLQCIFHILAYGAHTSYRLCAPEYEGKYNAMGYVGAGWIVEDRYKGEK